MAKRKTRRVKSPHPGVVLRKEKGRSGERWRARWTDPDTGRECRVTLDGKGLQLTNHERRYTWAVKKSKSLARRRAEIAAGGRVVQSLPVADAAESFLAGKRAECRKLTVDAYEQRLAVFLAWLEDNGVEETGELTRFHLAEYRTHVLELKKRAPAKGKKRGTRRPSRTTIGPRRRNDLLAAAGTLLSDWRRLGLLKSIDSDAIRDNLRPVKREHPLPDFLKPKEVRGLLEAARRHDDERFNLTRDEHDGLRKPGTTPRHPPAAPFLLAVILTGARRSEVEGLRWSEVHLNADVIVLAADRAKTRKGRRIDLGVTPSLVALLERLQLQSGGEERVFPEWANGGLAKSTRARLRRHGAPARWTYQKLRRTAATVLTNMRPVGPWLSSQRCGHSVSIAERSYVGLLSIPDSVTTMEAALGIEAVADAIVTDIGGIAEGGASRAREG